MTKRNNNFSKRDKKKKKKKKTETAPDQHLGASKIYEGA